MNTDMYASVLHLYQALPPLSDCLAAAQRMHFEALRTPSETAYKKALDFFVELIKTDIVSIRFDAKYLLAKHAFEQVVMSEDLVDLLERVSNLNAPELIRDDEKHILIRRPQSKNEGYRRASAFTCDCDFSINRPDSLVPCVHIAIVRVIETAFLSQTAFKLAEGVELSG